MWNYVIAHHMVLTGIYLRVHEVDWLPYKQAGGEIYTQRNILEEWKYSYSKFWPCFQWQNGFAEHFLNPKERHMIHCVFVWVDLNSELGNLKQNMNCCGLCSVFCITRGVELNDTESVNSNIILGNTKCSYSFII